MSEKQEFWNGCFGTFGLTFVHFCFGGLQFGEDFR
jgi:hypothetical protein